MNELSCDSINLVVVVSELREVSLDLESVSKTLCVAVCSYLSILDC